MDVCELEAPARLRSAKVARSTQVNVRVEPQQLATIDAAAEALGRTRTAFMLETAVHAAEAVLLDKRLFALDDDAYKKFVDRLDAPPSANPKLRALLHRKAPWER